MVTRAKLRQWLNRLNDHYGLSIKLRVSKDLDIPAYADVPNKTIRLRRNGALFDARVLAHEYAHMLVPAAGHGKRFEAQYKECCLVVGVFYLETERLQSMIRIECQKEERNEEH